MESHPGGCVGNLVLPRCVDADYRSQSRGAVDLLISVVEYFRNRPFTTRRSAVPFLGCGDFVLRQDAAACPICNNHPDAAQR